MTMTIGAFPTAPGEVTPQWLTTVLRSHDAIGSASVTACRPEPVGEGIGFVGQIARFALEYDTPHPAAPETLVAKFASPLEGGRRAAALLGLYAREVGFYTHLAADARIGTPRCYHADVTADGASCVILLEDLNDGRFGDQVAGIAVDDARVALVELARFHAAWWNHPGLQQHPWLMNSVDITRRTVTTAYDMLWPAFVHRFKDDLAPSVLEHGPRCGARVLAMLDRNASRTTATLRHSDFRVDNLFFPASGTRPLVVVDWQGALRSWSGAYDAVYFLATGLTIEDYRNHASGLLDTYYETLVGSGVSDYPRAQFDDDCRAGLLAAFTVIGVIAGGMLETVNQRSVDLFKAASNRMVAALDAADAWDA